MQRVVPMGSRFARVLAFAPLLILAGCPAGDPMFSRAEAVYQETIQANPEYQSYALTIAAGTDSALARQQVLQSLQSDNFQTALEAVHAVADDASEEARSALRQVFDSKPGALRMQAAIALGRGGDEAALAYLREQIGNPAQTLNIEAVTVVAAHGGQEFLTPVLEKRMKSDSLQVRDEAYAALGEIREPWATRLLVKGLGNERGEDRKQAIVALGRTGDPELAPQIERFVNTQGLVFATLEALGALGNPKAAAAVKKMVDNPEGTVKAYAAVALWRLGQKDEAVKILGGLLNDEDPTVRSVLAEQLAAVDDDTARGMLLSLAEDPDKAVRVAALRSLGAAPTSGLEPALRAAAADPEYEVATLALNILAKVGGETALTDLQPLLESENPYVALSAAHAILSIKGRAPQPA